MIHNQYRLIQTLSYVTWDPPMEDNYSNSVNLLRPEDYVPFGPFLQVAPDAGGIQLMIKYAPSGTPAFPTANRRIHDVTCIVEAAIQDLVTAANALLPNGWQPFQGLSTIVELGATLYVLPMARVSDEFV